MLPALFTAHPIGQTMAEEMPAVTKLAPPEHGFFSKVVSFHGIPIKSHEVVSDQAMAAAYEILARLLEHQPTVISNLVAAGAELHIIGRDQVTTDLPEWRQDKGKRLEEYGGLTRDQRTRGMGGLISSCGEENLLHLEADRYRGRDICVHEFSHCIRNHGVPDSVRTRFDDQFHRSLGQGLWLESYAATNPDEYFAELSMWYFGTHGDRHMTGAVPEDGPDGLKRYDPEAFLLFDEFYSGRMAVGILSIVSATAIDPASTSNHSKGWIAQIDEVINAPKYAQARWGLLVADLKSGDVLYEHDADKLFAPASTTKLYSVAAALETDHTFETPIYAKGTTDSKGAFRGDLILVARGDLTLGGRTDPQGHIVFKNTDHTYADGNEVTEWTDPDPLTGLNDLASQIAASGIKTVEGEVLIDDRLFEVAEGSGSGPSQLTPVVVNDNVIDVLVTPTTAGAPARVDWRPHSAIVQVDAQVQTVPASAEVKLSLNSAGHGRITVRGQIPADHKPILRFSEVEDPAAFARALLIESLRRNGIVVQASAFAPNRTDRLPATDNYEALRPVALFRSPPFREELKLIMKVSHNQHASILPLLLAARVGKRTLADGLHLEREALAHLGVDVSTISFGGGAGGTRSDFTTPHATVELLRGMAKTTSFEDYKAGLPILGVDGTLSKAVAAESPALGKVLAKTGTLFYENVLNDSFLLTSKALAGYMTTSHNRELAFAIFLNNGKLDHADETAQEGRLLGHLCEIIYEGL
jgi:D-alanyl-D-alanine carboxypeptidase/D-alanyl-D-alanine-endopeptidase (penicillin-binding protein 4)